MVGSGLLFDRMADGAAPPPTRVALLDRAPPARVEPSGGHWESVHPVLGTMVLEAAPQPAHRVAARAAGHENAPSRAPARRGERKKTAAVFGPQPLGEATIAHDDGLRP